MTRLAGLLALEGAAMHNYLRIYMANALFLHFAMHKNALLYLANLPFPHFAMYKNALFYLAK